MKDYYIGMDVHCNSTELAVEYRGRIVKRFRVPTTISALVEVLKGLGGRQRLALEEGPMAGWLYRNLKGHVDRMVVCDPRRNKYIACDGDKDDPIDAGKLAALHRGGYLRHVYHSEDEKRVELKRWVGLYHDSVKKATGTINRLRAEARMYGRRIPARAIKGAEARRDWLAGLENRQLADRLMLLGMGLDTVRQQRQLAKKRMLALGRGYEIIGYWQELPGIGAVRAHTFFAYIDTPYRFGRKNKLWKYCGVGLERSASGTDQRGRAKPAKLKAPWQCNKRLKSVAMGAAMSAIRQPGNGFQRRYERMIGAGVLPGNARRTVARHLTAVMWGMWKSQSRFAGVQT